MESHEQMSLLDRVQRKAEGDVARLPENGAAPSRAPDPHPTPQAPAAPETPSPAPATAAPAAPVAPTGWQVRHAPPRRTEQAAPESAPVPEFHAPAPAATAVAEPARETTAAPAASPAAAPAPQRPRTTPPLMGRTGSSTDAPAEANRQASLLNRTGFGGRGPLSKPGGGNQYAQLRSKVHQRLVEELAGSADSTPPEQVRQRIGELVNELVTEQNLTMTRQDKLRVVDTVIDDVLGLGPLEVLLHDPEITEIMINSPRQIYVEQHGKLSLSPVTFESNDHLMQVIDRIVSTIGRRVDELSPMVDARLKDGSRVNVIIPPLALRGPTVTIRKFAKEAFTVKDLVDFGSVTEDMMRYLRACVRASPQRRGQRWHRIREDDDPQHPLELHPRGRAHRHHRGRGRAPAAPGARRDSRDAPGQHRGPRARVDP